MKRALLVLIALVFSVTTAHAATVTGTVKFEGAAPAPAKLNAGADAHCKAQHPNGLEDDSVVVNADGTLKNVLVYVKSGLEGKTFPAPKDAVKLDQHGCMYNPKVFGIQAGQPLEIVNSDDTLHNVHALPKNSPQFNLGMPVKNMKVKKSFAKPEVPVKIKCEVHPWMGAWVGVFDNPFYGVSGDNGKFELKDLPPGSYVIEAWHEKFGTQTQNVTVTDQPQDISFSFKQA